MAKIDGSEGNPIAWVHTVPEDEAEGLVKRYYEAGREKFGSPANISRPFSNRPELMRAHRGLYLTLMHGDSRLSRVEREFVAIAVSKANGCFY
ncbi:MAG: peroxidase [Nitrospinaceae bacterium]|jgi:alkylhydroperoxidase family enzyme|nr:peroxidase [Nitrospinaceae bacterium]MBT3433748.1 peroxidase [Nitrospinaceae bacterium]MBT3822612.1 peroxidase [Nitrospinaceae bacterium]MBT4092681.1 peroxidase [Nitrospinaceae bacterium]MBT4432191.1 peroxidase [Nitrospinaceae bacterium]